MNINLQTQIDNNPPSNINIALMNDDYDDDIKKLGDRIANLTIKECIEVNQYIEYLTNKNKP